MDAELARQVLASQADLLQAAHSGETAVLTAVGKPELKPIAKDLIQAKEGNVLQMLGKAKERAPRVGAETVRQIFAPIGTDSENGVFTPEAAQLSHEARLQEIMWTDFLNKGYDGLQDITVGSTTWTIDQVQRDLRSQVLLIAQTNPLVERNVIGKTETELADMAADFLRQPDLKIEFMNELLRARKREGEYAIDLTSRDKAQNNYYQTNKSFIDGFDGTKEEQVHAAERRFESERENRNIQEADLLNNTATMIGKAYENMLAKQADVLIDPLRKTIDEATAAVKAADAQAALTKTTTQEQMQRREYEKHRGELAKGMANRWLNGGITAKLTTEYQWLNIRDDFRTFINGGDTKAMDLVKGIVPGITGLPQQDQEKLQEFAVGKLMEFATVVKQGNFSQQELIKMDAIPVLQTILEKQRKTMGEDMFTRKKREFEASKGNKGALLRLVRDPMSWIYVIGAAGMVAQVAEKEEQKVA